VTWDTDFPETSFVMTATSVRDLLMALKRGFILGSVLPAV
jgi:hypothetical protein